ncbi:hypothetical protein [Nonomuraea africana]|uniref:Uncharacterized protein n=1 Tax=Nonomuraea africana TaxID=46171 RepID=A0ABR9KFR6_9ACTN|nr:hypothetical protein [Nonomuraea africana]
MTATDARTLPIGAAFDRMPPAAHGCCGARDTTFVRHRATG